MSPLRILAFGLATGSAMAYAWVAVNNWRRVILRLRKPTLFRPPLIYLAGPILAVLLVQGLRYAGAPLSDRALAAVALLGFVLDPAALPALVVAVGRWLWSGVRG